ncbi:MAG: nucleoside triphosphate pyrophosphohydrolase [Pyrinomonadaceae bacterium]|nr:nucleoside triphosphate pyrophosphohydrolase [Pyrinomonadaceae bacterium]MCX7640073.1 nucleoside triphosphate pyrophosphohydrolase [Pyrinomonadaceae bacterium]MDW8304245.1 nucleoside triphosphate pyrophosphohydrolase [Acidobacteriota bacterium]
MSVEFDKLMETMRRLRAPEGCPWDREQTHQSLAPYLVEECYEAFSAIQENDIVELKEELGDVLLQVVFHSVIAEEKDEFTIRDVIEGITQKLVLRHPHVFENEEFSTAEEVLKNWDKLKLREREKRGKLSKNGNSILDSVPSHFPALIEALKLTKEAAKVGFDWEAVEHVFDKLDEETKELKAAISIDKSEKIEEEIGDLLFVVVNLARKLGIEPETALKKANAKFRERFNKVESELRKVGKSLQEATLEDMDKLWEKAKLG